jgi:glycosidase
MPEITFRYQPPTAGRHEVGLAGDFSNWRILDLNDRGGVYVLSLHVEKGRYRYKFIVDGHWLPDPNNPLCEPDPFGGTNSLLVIEDDTRGRLSWHQVSEDMTLLDERQGHYIEVIRISADSYELRFNWHPSLPAVLIAFIDGKEHRLNRLGTTGGKDVHHCSFETVSPRIGVLVKAEGPDITLFYGISGFTSEGDGASPLEIDLAELPVFDVPDWVHRSVIYQIFPDRFYNGDPSNDPDFQEDYYDGSRTPPRQGELLPSNREYYHLVRDWMDISGLKQSPWQEEGKPDWWSFYGGDIAGVRRKLPYLIDLGIDCIYFNPLWKAKSNHKYDAADFCSIDPHFGSEREMRELVEEAHKAGIRIIVDVAFNHTGEDFWAFRDCVEKGPDSPYWNWYDWQQWPLPDPLPLDFQPKQYYQCWWGIKDMPDLNYDLSRPHPAENYVKDITHAVPNQPLVDHILQTATWWLNGIGIDGFRLDVPDEVPFWFWELFRRHVKSIKPDAWLVGEIWQSASGWIGERYFDSVMNYAHFKDPVLEFFIQGGMSSKSFREGIEEGLALYPRHAAGAMMNLLGSHDTLRVLELAGGDTGRLKLAQLFQMTFFGAPHIYYGDEIAMCGGRDPDNRRPFNWDWEQDPQAVDLHGYVRDLIKIRRSNPVLTGGEFGFMDLPDGLLGWKRFQGEESVCVITNYSTTGHMIPGLDAKSLLFRAGEVEPRPGGILLAPLAGVVYQG